MTTVAPSKKLLKRKLKKKATPPADVAYPMLETLFERIDVINRQIKGLKLELDIRHEEALRFMRDKGIETYSRGKYQGTPVYPTGEEVNWDGIKGVLDPKGFWTQILGEPQPVKAKLEALIELGLVTKEDIADFVADKPIKPHVKITALTS